MREAAICASGFPVQQAQLPTVWAVIGGRRCKALVDSGCSRTVVASTAVQNLVVSRAVCKRIRMMNGDTVECSRAAVVDMEVHGQRVSLDCLVTTVVPSFDVLLGMDAVCRLGGVHISPNGRTEFGGAQGCVAVTDGGELEIVDQDFKAVFRDGAWNVAWSWTGEPPVLENYIPSYKVAHEVREKYEEEIQEWIRQGWLQPFDGDHDGIIPLLAVLQRSKDKVRPVLDYRELNQHVSSHTANGEVCGKKIRAWRRMGTNLSMVDLRKAYLQIRVDPSLWKYQVVEHNGARYCLTRLGFGMNVAPKIMTSIVNKVLALDPEVRAATDSYVDDIIVNEDAVSSQRVVDHLRTFGLEPKPPVALHGSRVLGLHVSKEDGTWRWSRGNIVDPLGERVTKRQVFAWCGQMTAHFPVAGWLRVACSFLKRCTGDLKWDDLVSERAQQLLAEVSKRVHECDPVRGVWAVPPSTSARVWCDASSLAVGVALEIDGNVVEDATWLRKQDDPTHINLAELEAVLRGLNLALAWDIAQLEIITDSATVHSWVTSLLNGDRPLRVKGLGEALVRRRLSLIGDIVKEYAVVASISLVQSQCNKADALTRVPRTWLAGTTTMCATMTEELQPGPDLAALHAQHHFGTDRTLYLAQRCYPEASIARRDVEAVVRGCHRCKSIDPAPVRWDSGKLDVATNWYRVACDVTHYGGDMYLSLVDCGPSRFAIWRRIAAEGAAEVVRQFEEIFRERGPPWQLLLDNSATFRGTALQSLCTKWGVDLVFRAAYRPSGNGIVERHHRTIKTLAQRTGASVLDMVYWYNVTPTDRLNADTVPSSVVSTYLWKLPSEHVSPPAPPLHQRKFSAGHHVYVKPPGARCTTRWRRGVVTNEVAGPLTVEVDGVPRHIADIRVCEASSDSESKVDSTEEEDGETEAPSAVSVRPQRTSIIPRRFSDYVM